MTEQKGELPIILNERRKGSSEDNHDKKNPTKQQS
jgi:hypothetical protein